MSLTVDEADHLIQTIVTTREQWHIEEHHLSTRRKVHYIEDLKGFKDIMNTKGKPIETLKAERIDLCSIYQQEDELYETLQSFKH